MTMRISEVYLWPTLQVCLQPYDNKYCDVFSSKAKYTGLHFTEERILYIYKLITQTLS